MAKIGYWSNLKGENVVSDGQVLRSRAILSEIRHNFDDTDVYVVDVSKWRKRPLKTFYETIKMITKSKTIIVSTSYGGLNLLLKIVDVFFKKRKRDFILIAVGGRLNKYVGENNKNAKMLMDFKALLVQGKQQLEDLSKMGYTNVELFPNFREYKPFLAKYEFQGRTTIDLCVFSRIAKEKGVIDAIHAVYEANKILGENIFTIDFYGNIGEDFEEEFFSEMSLLGDNGKYKGVAKSEDAPNILRNYFMLLFLTYHDGEGQAGTILDSYFAGIPVIATDWNLNHEFVFNEINGFLVKVQSPSEVAKILVYAYKNYEKVNLMRKQSNVLAEKYSASKVMPTLYKYLEEDIK